MEQYDVKYVRKDLYESLQTRLATAEGKLTGADRICRELISEKEIVLERVENAEGELEKYKDLYSHYFVVPNLDEVSETQSRFCDDCGLYITDDIHKRAESLTNPSEEQSK